QDASGTWQRYEYDAAGRLKTVKDDSNNALEIATFGATGKRLISESSTGRTYHISDGGTEIAEFTEASSSTTPDYSRSYIYAAGRLLVTATRTSATTEAMETDHTDQSGAKVVTNVDTGTWYHQS